MLRSQQADVVGTWKITLKAVWMMKAWLSERSKNIGGLLTKLLRYGAHGDANTRSSTAHGFLSLFFPTEHIVCYEFICICFLQINHIFSDRGKYLPATLNIRKS